MAATAAQALPLHSQGSLRQQGYRLETTFGWTSHQLPLYAHAPGKIRGVGEVAFQMRVGNLKHLEPAEADYLARKGSQGFFMWKPDECLQHEFTPVEIQQRPGGGVIAVKGDRVYGCKWCRAAQNNGLQGEASQPDISADESSARAAEQAPPAIDGVACSMCDAVMSSVAKSGKPRSKAQQLHSLKLHTMRKHAE